MMGDDVDGFRESGEVGYLRRIVGGGAKQTVIVPSTIFGYFFSRETPLLNHPCAEHF